MRLVENLENVKPDYIIITGDGRRELYVLRGLTKVYNGHDIILYFPFTPVFRKTGKKALDSIKTISAKFGINSIIYIVDGEAFNNSFINEIQNYLRSIGIAIENVDLIQNALLIKCKSGNHNIKLYCIVSGPQMFIEEEIAQLLKLKFGEDIDLSGNRDSTWRKRVKDDIDRVLKKNRIKKLEKLIDTTSKKKLEASFPNICAVLKKIEEEHKL